MTDSGDRKHIYLETNVFIRAVEGTYETAAPAKKLIEAARHRHVSAVTSEITIAEVLAPPKRSDALPLHTKRRVYLDLLIWGGFITLVPVSRSVLIETADVRTTANLKLPDAIHLVSAINSGCRYLVSHDDDFKKLPSGIVLIKPDEPGIDYLLGQLT